MKEKMKAAVMTGINEMEIQEKEVPTPKDNQVLIKIRHVGVCGSDMHLYQSGAIGSYKFEEPLILGHESAGEVVELGENVKNLKVGDRVALEPGVPCGKCEFCKQGKYNLCKDVEFMAIPGADGAFVEYVLHPADMAFKLPENVDTIEGALIEPLAVGFHAADLAEAKIGDSAVILGAGCIGLVTLMVLQAMGLNDIYIVDVIEKRLNKAKELGAKEVINAKNSDTVNEIMKLTNNEGTSLVFETAGSKPTTNITSKLIKRGGTIAIVGMAGDVEIPYNFSAITWKEAKIKTVFRYRNMYPKAIKAVSDGLIPLKEIVSDYIAFDNLKDGFENNIKNKKDIIKSVVEL